MTWSEADPLTVFLCRHGQTALNAEYRLRGLADVPLDATGRSQAAALGALFAHVAVDRIVASPLQRACDTATEIGRVVGVAVEPREDLNDRDYGPWTGERQAEVEARFGSVEAAPGVESRAAAGARIHAAFDALLAERPLRCLVMVGHDATHGALLARLLPELAPDDAPLAQATACWNQITRRDGRWSAVVINAVPGDGRHPARD